MTCATCGHDKASHVETGGFMPDGRKCVYVAHVAGMRQMCPCPAFSMAPADADALAVIMPLVMAPTMEQRGERFDMRMIPSGTQGVVTEAADGVVRMTQGMHVGEEVYSSWISMSPDAADQLARNLVTSAQKARQSMPRMPA